MSNKILELKDIRYRYEDAAKLRDQLKEVSE